MADEKQIKVPDIGGATAVDVIEILVKVGDVITKDTPLITLESDKASMEIPSPIAGVVRSLQTKVGDKIAEGDVILMLSVEDTEASAPVVKEAPVESAVDKEPPVSISTAPEKTNPVEQPVLSAMDFEEAQGTVSAGPAVRRLARELGVNLSLVKGSGRKSRISKDDIAAYIKHRLSQGSGAASFALPAAPAIDFSKFGNIEIKPLNKIKRLTGVNLHRAWATIPHVTQFDEADITSLEAFRKAEVLSSPEIKLTILAFVCKVTG